MKRMIGVLLSLLMLSAVAVAEEATGAQIIGTITEMRAGGGFLVKPLDGGQTVQVNVDSATVSGAEWTVGEGDVVIVNYDGRMTRSMPGQIMAQSIYAYSLEGAVVEVDGANNRLLVETQQAGRVWVTMPDGEQASNYADKVVRVYTHGVMALSYPAQTSALAIATIEMVEGTASGVTDSQFTLDGEGGQLIVHYDEHTKVTELFTDGNTVQVFYSGVMTMSLPGQITAIVIAKVGV